ncbi:MAG: tRNA 2-thiocytidine(32) synthetase TtcA [Deltaproteobacteria bacterium]|nr:MAG: tRNA 2-thiocytidine(32) synthetase TtcA [Deltaproteobacteria bacterium]
MPHIDRLSLRSADRVPRGDAPALLRAIAKKAGRCIDDFDLIEPGDRIMVCLSGGKDSYALLDVLRHLQARAPIRFDLLAVNVDQGWPGYEVERLRAFLVAEGVPYELVAEDFASVVEANLPAGATPCSLCSRLRRGVLYNLADRLGCSKIALGHHMDDLIETVVLNLFFSGRLASMPPLLRSDDSRNTVIRPLAYVPESWLAAYAQRRGFPILSCACPTCGLPDQKRQVVKRLLAALEADHPGLKHQMLAALRNVHPSHLLDARLPGAPGHRR